MTCPRSHHFYMSSKNIYHQLHSSHGPRKLRAEGRERTSIGSGDDSVADPSDSALQPGVWRQALPVLPAPRLGETFLPSRPTFPNPENRFNRHNDSDLPNESGKLKEVI